MINIKRKSLIIFVVFILIFLFYYFFNNYNKIAGNRNDHNPIDDSFNNFIDDSTNDFINNSIVDSAIDFQDDELMTVNNFESYIEKDGFIVIDKLNVNEKNIYFGYYEDGFFEIKFENNDFIKNLSLIDSWGELPRIHNIDDILRFNDFELHWISDSTNEYGTAALINYIDAQGYGIFRIWLCDIYNIQIHEFVYTDWWVTDNIFITRNNHEIMTLEIPFLDINKSFSIDDETNKYFDYLEIPFYEKVLYEKDYYLHIIGYQINEDSMEVSYRFRTGVYDWIPNLKVTFQFTDGGIYIIDAVLE